jgi:hypothetical protein
MAGRGFDLRPRSQDRVNLFGKPASSDTSRNGLADPSLMEQGNDQQIDHLHGQVNSLRDISLNLKSHIEESNKLLGNMEGSFGIALGQIRGLVSKLGLLGTQGGWTTCKLAVIVVIVVLLTLLFSYFFLITKNKLNSH